MPTVPTLAAVITDGVRAHLNELMTATVGKVTAYNPLFDTVDVLPMILRPFSQDGETVHEELPILPDIPIVWPRAGGYILHMPIAQGDTVLLVFSHDCTDGWRETGAQSAPGDLRRHSLSNAVAVPGVFPQTAPLSADPTQAASRLAGLVIGQEGTTNQIEVSDLGIALGHLAVMPVALAPPVVSLLAAVSVWVAAVQAALVAPSNVLPALVGATLAPATAALTAAVTSLSATVPSTKTRSL
jgi:hypothetical protein